MKMQLAFLTSVLTLLVLSTAILAEHSATISVSPDTWELGTESTIDITVTSASSSKSPITKIEVSVPVEDGETVYKVRNAVGTSSGWIYEGTIVDGELQKLTFTSSAGLGAGRSAVFTVLGVTAPSTQRQTIWNWKTFDAAGNESVGQFVTAATVGPLAEFTLSDVPNEITLGDVFTAKVTALDAHGLVKANYAGRVVITSTDSEATITPAIIQFTGEENGTASFTVAYSSIGTFTFTATDADANVSARSTTDVLAPVPRELSIKINNDAPSTAGREVTLAISGRLAEQCRFSNDRLFWTDYTEFSTSRNWQLPEGIGVKTVYMQCSNSYGESEIVSDSITLTAASPLPTTGLIPGVSVSTLLSGLAFFISLGALYFALRKGKKTTE